MPLSPLPSIEFCTYEQLTVLPFSAVLSTSSAPAAHFPRFVASASRAFRDWMNSCCCSWRGQRQGVAIGEWFWCFCLTPLLCELPSIVFLSSLISGCFFGNLLLAHASLFRSCSGAHSMTSSHSSCRLDFGLLALVGIVFLLSTSKASSSSSRLCLCRF